MELLETISFEKPIRSVSRPFPVLCSDFNTYYVKFPIDATDNTDLIYESVCKTLGDHFNVPIPDIAYIKASEGSWSALSFPSLQAGLIGFGSKEVSNPNVLSKETALISSKHDFNRIANPSDLLRIGIFDLFIKNTDRSEDNFNLITSYGSKDSVFAIDHVATFGGSIAKGRFSPKMESDVGKNILRSEYGRAILKYIDSSERRLLLLEFITQLNNIEDVLNVAFERIPAEWQLTEDLKARICDFLTNDERNYSIKEQFERLFRIL